MKKILYGCLFVILISILGFFIFKDKKNENKIVVSEVTHSVFYAPWYIAIEEGYFEDENLEIEVLLTPGADKVAASVLSGDANIGFSGPEATMYVHINGSSETLKTFSSLTKRDGQFIVGPCDLKDNFTLSDLKGKSLLAGRSGGMPLMMFKYALQKAGIKESEVHIDTSVEFASLSSAFISNQGDFVNLFEPNALAIEKQEYGCVLGSLGQLSGEVPYTTFYAKESYIKDNKNNIEKFVKALNKGLDFVHENDSETIAKSIIKQFPDTTLSDLTKIIERYKKADSWYKTTYVEEDDYTRLMEIMIYNKTLDKLLDIELLVTNEFNK